MNKIAFIASGHSGSTLPLIKALIDVGYYVDYYILCCNQIEHLEATDCKFQATNRGIEEIPRANWQLLSSKYIQSPNFRIFSINTYRPFENNRFLNRIVGIARQYQIRKACKYINEQGYKLVNFIGRYQVSDIIRYSKYIQSKYIVSFHEVCEHHNPDFEHPNNVLRYLFKKQIPIVLFSDKSLDDIKRYRGSETGVFVRENFGKFDSFKIYQGRKSLELPDDYVLFIGRLTPYKGLRLFYEATKELARIGNNFVVAGNGRDEALADIKKTPNYTIINRYLTDEDFVELVERCSFVVCPYTSMSQSGIPQTVFVFNKTIVATDLGGFRDIICDKKNGLLFPLNNQQKLMECISLLAALPHKREELEQGVRIFDQMFPLYSWNEIANKYQRDFL